MKTIKETCYKGTRILLGNDKQEYLQKCRDYLKLEGYTEISIPIIQHESIFVDKVGEENNNLMYNFVDRGNRNLCLAPEYTAVIQKLADTTFKNQKDVKLFYVQECFRGEKPQRGRFRQFTQLGVEVLNPSMQYNLSLIAMNLCNIYKFQDYGIDFDATRGLDYYKDGKGFEISLDAAGSTYQIVGGGEYEKGTGFAIGVDRLLDL